MSAGPDGEINASLRYLSQRYSMPFDVARAVLTDVGTEELAHLEIVGSIIHQLTKNCTPEDIKKYGLEAYYVDHGLGVYPQAASGVPQTSMAIAVKGDVLADLTEDLAADAPNNKCTTFSKIIESV